MRSRDNVKVEFREIIVRELDGTGSRICPVVDFGVIGVSLRSNPLSCSRMFSYLFICGF
jgi:hypothetical protein